MTLVIRTEEACKPPKTMGKRALLYSANNKNQEKSKYQIHQEREMWSRLKGSKDPYLVMLFKTSWGDEGDGIKVIHRPRHGPTETAKPPPKPSNPQGLATQFSYPPQRNTRRSDLGRSSSSPSEDRILWAERILRDTKIDKNNVQQHVSSITSLISILKQQGKMKEADEHREALNVLISHGGRDSSKRRDHTNLSLLARKRVPCIARTAAKMTSALKLQQLETSAGKNDKMLQSVSGDISSTNIHEPQSISPRNLTAKYGCIDFYDRQLYQRRQKEERERRDTNKDPAWRRRRGSESEDEIPISEEIEKSAVRGRTVLHRPHCNYHVDNVHPIYKIAGYKAPFKFPRKGLVLSTKRVTAAHKGTTFITSLVNQKDVGDHFPVSIMNDSQPKIMQATVGNKKHRQLFKTEIPEELLQPNNSNQLKSSDNGSLSDGDHDDDNKNHISNQTQEFNDDTSSCSCSSAPCDDSTTEYKVSTWRKSWHLTRSRLDHDLQLLLNLRDECRQEVYQSVEHLGKMSSATLDGCRSWSRCRHRPKSSFPVYKHNNNQTNDHSQPTPSFQDGGSQILTDHDQSLDPHEAAKSCGEHIQTIKHVNNLLLQGVQEVGTTKDGIQFRTQISDLLREGKTWLIDAKTLYGRTAALDIPLRERLLLELTRVKKDFKKYYAIYNATAARHQIPDLITRNPASLEWGKSMWLTARIDMERSSSQLQKSQKLYHSVLQYCKPFNFPSTVEQQEFLSTLRRMLLDRVALSSSFIEELVSRTSNLFINRDVVKVAGFVASELSATDLFNSLVREVQQKGGVSDVGVFI